MEPMPGRNVKAASLSSPLPLLDRLTPRLRLKKISHILVVQPVCFAPPRWFRFTHIDVPTPSTTALNSGNTRPSSVSILAHKCRQFGWMFTYFDVGGNTA